MLEAAEIEGTPMRARRRHLVLAAVAVLALTGAACSSGVSEPEARGTEPAEAAASEADVTVAEDGTEATPYEPAEHTEDAADHGGDGVAADHDEEAGADVDRTVEVEMTEFAFTPAELTFSAGETVRFVFTNTGEVEHEAVLGDVHVQQEHEQAMAEGMDDHGDGESAGGHHGDIPSVTVPAGETRELVHTFRGSGELMLGCHLPGHWDAGMQAELDVTAWQPPRRTASTLDT